MFAPTTGIFWGDYTSPSLQPQEPFDQELFEDDPLLPGQDGEEWPDSRHALSPSKKFISWGRSSADLGRTSSAGPHWAESGAI